MGLKALELLVIRINSKLNEKIKFTNLIYSYIYVYNHVHI